MIIKSFIVKIVIPLAFLAGVIAVVAFFATELMRSQTVTTTVNDFQIDRSYSAVSRGSDLYITRRCAQCHGTDLGGAVFLQDKWMGTVAGGNLTTGDGGVAGEYHFGSDWARAIRLGVNTHSHPFMYMPCGEYSNLTDTDLNALIAYIMSASPVDRHLPKVAPGAWPRSLFVLGLFSDLIPYISSDSRKPHPHDLPIALTPEYGQYIATDCATCHGDNLTGGFVPGMPPQWPKAPSLKASGSMAGYTADSFKEFMRTGKTVSGRQLDAAVQPWTATSRLRDIEVDALYLYLKGVN